VLRDLSVQGPRNTLFKNIPVMSLYAVDKGIRGSINSAAASHEWADTHSVHTLKLNGNRISSIEGLNDLFESAVFINLSGNEIESINPLHLAGMNSLQVLDLACNSLTEIPPGAFPPMASLFKLNLAYNSITSIEGL